MLNIKKENSKTWSEERIADEFVQRCPVKKVFLEISQIS